MASYKQATKEFIINVSAAGLQRIFFPTSSQPLTQLFRLVWLIVWLSAAALMTYQISTIIQSYYEYETVTKISIEQRDSVAFPEVTICDLHGLHKLKFDAWLNNCDENNDEKLTRICKYAKDQYHEITDNEDDLDAREKVKRLSEFERQLDHNLSLNFPDKAKELSRSWSELFKKTPKNQFNGIHYNETELEQMWRFNFRQTSRHDVKERGGNCYSFNSNNDHWQTQPHLEGGLIIYLNKGKKITTHCLSDCSGCYSVVLHAPGTVPLFTQGDVMLVCNSTAIDYQFEERINKGPPYGNCITTMPRDMVERYPQMAKYNYTINACMAFKYNDEIPLIPIGDDTDLPNPVQCLPECFQRLYDHKCR